MKFFVNSSGKRAEMSNLSMSAKVLKVSGGLEEMNLWERSYQKVLIEDYGLTFGQRLFTCTYHPGGRASSMKNPIFRTSIVVVRKKFVPMTKWGPDF
jgi:hypothetical protein